MCYASEQKPYFYEKSYSKLPKNKLKIPHKGFKKSKIDFWYKVTFELVQSHF